MHESGLKDYDVASWNGISVPAATPKTVIDTLARAIERRYSRTPRSSDKSRHLGMEMHASTADEMTARMKADIAKWAAVIAKAGIPKHE